MIITKMPPKRSITKTPLDQKIQETTLNLQFKLELNSMALFNDISVFSDSLNDLFLLIS